MANVGAGVFQGMPVSTSLSASSLNESAGARTPVASLITGALVLATLLVLAPLFSDLPKAVLGAIIIDAVVFGMIDVAELRRLHRVTRFDFWIAVAAILGVLSAGSSPGVVIGAVLSLGWLIYVATRPAMPLLGREAGTQVFRDLDEHPGRRDAPRHHRPPLRRRPLLRHGRGTRRPGAQRGRGRRSAAARSCSTSRASTSSTRRASAKLSELHQLAEAHNVTLRLARVKPHVLRVLEPDGVVDLIGADRIHGSVDRAVEAQLADDRVARR